MCVFCGSRPGADPAYLKDAIELGRSMVKRRCALVYGEGATGMMGVATASGALLEFNAET